MANSTLAVTRHRLHPPTDLGRRGRVNGRRLDLGCCRMDVRRRGRYMGHADFGSGRIDGRRGCLWRGCVDGWCGGLGRRDLDLRRGGLGRLGGRCRLRSGCRLSSGCRLRSRRRLGRLRRLRCFRRFGGLGRFRGTGRFRRSRRRGASTGLAALGVFRPWQASRA